MSPATVCVWRHRNSPDDRSCKPHEPDYAFGEAEQALILALRRWGLALDDLVDAVRVPMPDAKRATVHRVRVRHKLSRLSDLSEGRDIQELVQGVRPRLRAHGLLLPAQA